MKHYYTRKILNKEQLKEIKDFIEISNENNLWVDGLISSMGQTKSDKNNLELNNFELSQKIHNIIMCSLDKDEDFLNFTVATETMLNIVSKMEEECFYKPHTDHWENGDFSTTVFLNEPEEYEGGELCLYFGGDDEIKIKLNAGYGITYPTGILHRVNKVKSGNRYVSVFWTKTLIKDPFIRSIYSEISNVLNQISNNPIHITDCSSLNRDPVFCLGNLKTEILRRYRGN
jgi:PKHD-type hydroxylase